jgi:hypothetical protein
MQFYAMNDDYRPSVLIENWSSLIWTERYRSAGEFELKTADIAKTKAALPLGTCVTLLDTQEVCLVENIEIARDANGTPTLTVSGRSFETFFENRTTLVSPDPIKDAANDTNATEVNDQTAPFAANKLIDNARSPNVDPADEIPGINGTVTAESQAGDALNDRVIARGDTYSEFIKILEEAQCGVRNIRPTPKSSDMTVGTYQYWSEESFNPDVALDVLSGHFVGAVRYTWSNKDMKTAVYVASKNYFIKVFASGQSSNIGLKHRVGLLDFGDITKTGTKITNQLKSKGKSYLAEHKAKFFLEGTVSPDIPYIYNTDYGLGDRIKVRGDWGAEGTMQVVEYIRSEDENGETAYPTLS